MSPVAAGAGLQGAPPGEVPGGVASVTRAAELYLVLLPCAQLVVVPVAGALATAADLLLGLLLLSAVVALPRVRASGGPGVPRDVARAGVVLLGFGGWTAASALWGFHPGYALAKGGAVVAFSLAILVLGGWGVEWRRLADAWLLGAALALVVAALGWALGPEALRERVLYGAGAVAGLPFPRVQGPFLHPSMAGDYWVVTGALLWARWPELHGWRRSAGAAGAVALVAALALTVSTAWIAGGVLLVVLARSEHGRRGAAALAGRAAGLVLVAGGVAAVLKPLAFRLGPLALRTGAVRPAIWVSSLRAVATAPLLGVGAAPYLAEAPDPLDAGVVRLWDAHDTYLSVVGQFGAVGLVLLAAGVLLLVAALVRRRPSRVRTALLGALAAVAVHGLFVAGEDFRHWWALAALVGCWVGGQAPAGDGEAG